MLILVPLKTQENAVAKLKRGKKISYQMGSSCIFKTWEGYYKKLESKIERGKRNVKRMIVYLIISSIKVKECIHNSLKETRNSSLRGFIPLLCK